VGKISKVLDKASQEESASNSVEVGSPTDEVEASPQESPAKTTRKAARRETKVGMATSWDERLTRATMVTGPAAESFRTLRSRILHPATGIVPKSLLITSAIPGEGKSFVCANLGVALAQGVDQYCLMVDCDLRKPALHRLFGLSPSVGLVNHLRDKEELPSLLLPTGIETLSLLPAGPPPRESLRAARFRFHGPPDRRT
jgi:Mrp family chromosome partitioning ATPase